MSDPDSGGSPTLGRRELQDRAIKGAMWTGIHTLVSLPLAFAVNILLARVLGVVGYGRLAYLTTLITIASSLASLGVTSALIQFGSKAHAAGRHGQVQRLLSGAQGFQLLVVGPVIAAAVIAFVEVEPWLLVIALVFGVGAPALLSNAHPALTIENRTDRSAQITMVGNVVIQSCVVLAVLTVGTADAVWSARVIATGVLLLLPLVIISRRYRAAVVRPRPPWTLPRTFWRFAIPTGLAGALGALTSNRVEVLLLDWFADPVAMGLFGLAFGLAGHLFAPAQALVGPLVPAVSALTEVDTGMVRTAFLRTSRVAATVGGGLVATALPALAVLVPLLYGDQFRDAADHVVVLGMAGAVMLIGSPTAAFLLARLGAARMLWINIAVLVVNIGAGLALIPLIGVWGATACCAAGMLVRAALLIYGEARAIGVTNRVLNRAVGGMWAGLVCCALVWGVVRSLDVPALPLAALSVACGAVLYLAALRLGRVGLEGADVAAISRGLPARIRPAAVPLLGLTARAPRG